MAKLFVRITGALGATALAVCFLGLIPFLSAVPSGAGYVPSTPRRHGEPRPQGRPLADA